MNRGVVAAAVLSLVIGVVGYVSITASKYNEVGMLASLDSPSRVTVRGEVVDLGTGEGVLVYKGERYRLECRGAYAMAESSGSGSLVLFLLRGGNGFVAAALYPSADFISRYGGSPIVDREIVVDSVYRPGERVSIILPGGGVEAPVIEINSILKGCHSSYGQEQAVVNR